MSSVVSGRNKFKQNTEMVITYIYVVSIYIPELKIYILVLTALTKFYYFICLLGKGVRGHKETQEIYTDSYSIRL